MALLNFKIFSLNRLKLDELTEDVFTYLKRVYNTTGNEFTDASPFVQIIKVILNLGRMIFYYIESSITELNINTAFHERSIKGLSVLTGHNPSRGISARGSLTMTYNKSSNIEGQNITINNYTKIKNNSNNLTYIIVFSNNNMQLTIGAHDSNIEIPIIQGTLKYQQATGTGYGLQSFNFAASNTETIDNFFINIYVNGERWANVTSLLDMAYNQKACIIKTSINSGVDVYFGTGELGMIPPQGSSIICEYLLTAGEAGNILSSTDNDYWEFEDSGYDINGNYINLNEIYNLSTKTDIIFGTAEENIEITRQIAPYTSRSFVLANATNYKYFLSKLNIFSTIDAFSGFNILENSKIESQYLEAKNNYNNIKESYLAQLNLTGKSSNDTITLYNKLTTAKNTLDILEIKYNESKLDDNIIYLYLIPDITKRIDNTENYFTCDISKFTLTETEKTGIINLIEDSGQKISIIENRIIDPIFAKFAINIFIQMWSNYDFNSVKSTIISVVSNYLISNTRRDRIPVSDIIKIVENVSGVDSVSILFDADTNNQTYYGSGNYGIDNYGDIILQRNIIDKLGNIIELNDILPLFRGAFTSYNDIDYLDDINSIHSTINITLRGKSIN